MYFDARTIAAVTSELQTAVVGGRIQRIVLTGVASVGLEIYAQHRRLMLLASADAQVARVHLVDQAVTRGVDRPSPFLLVMRRHVTGGRILAVEQPPLERILVLSIAATTLSSNREKGSQDDTNDALPEVGPPRILRLVLEPMGRWSNIILLDSDDTVLECIKHVTPKMSRRPMQPHCHYTPPPVASRLDPRSVSALEIRDAVVASQQPRSQPLSPSGAESASSGSAKGRGDEVAPPNLARSLVAVFQGVSPLLAQEAVFRAVGQTDLPVEPDLPWQALATALQRLWNGPTQPGLVYEDEQVVAFAPYQLTHRAGWLASESMNAALATFYAVRDQVSRHEAYRATVHERISDALERLGVQRSQLQTALRAAEEAERWRWEGEMLLAFMAVIQRGQTVFEVEGRSITLDPQRTALDQAQERFKRYRKAQSGLEGIPQRLAHTEQRIFGLEELLALLETADGREQMDQLARELERYGLKAQTEQENEAQKRPKKQPRAVRIRPLTIASSDGYTILVGRSAEQNAELTFRTAQPDDWWLHARGIPGAHVIVRSEGREVPERTFEEAAALAAWFSRARNDAAVEVDLARRRRVRKVSGGMPGLVTCQPERTLRVMPQSPEASKEP